MTDFFQLSIYYGEVLGQTALITKDNFVGLKTSGDKNYFIWKEGDRTIMSLMSSDYKKVVDSLILGQKIIFIDLLQPGSEEENLEKVENQS